MSSLENKMKVMDFTIRVIEKMSITRLDLTNKAIEEIYKKINELLEKD